MDSPIVDIVLPVRNAADTLADAVASIRRQTFPDWRLLLFDDGSTDGSVDIATQFAHEDARIETVVSEHVGIVEALRMACVRGCAEFIARMDADDVAHPERIARQWTLMREDDCIAISGTGVRMLGGPIGCGRRRYETWINGLAGHEAIIRELFVECPIPHPTFMMRRTAFEAIGGYEDHAWAEDYDVCMRFFLAGARFAKTPETLLDWRETRGRLSMSSPRYAPARFRALKRHYLFKSYLADRGTFHQWGAGEVGKPWLREWGDRRPVAVVDINPRKIGRTIHATPVIPPEALPSPGETFVVVAVGAPDARQVIRSWLLPRGYRELRDFLFLA